MTLACIYRQPQWLSRGDDKVKGDGEIKQQKPCSGKKKKWPTAWTVSEIAASFKHVEEGQRQQGTVKVLFEQAFCQPIVQLTFYVNHKWWNEVSEGLKACFISYEVRVHHGYGEHRGILVTVVTVTVTVSNFSTPCIPCTLTRK